MIAIVVAGLGTYWNSLSIPFVWDDETAIVTNQTIRSLWPPSLPFSPPPETPVSGRPIANLSLAATYAVSGLEPSGFHLWNVGFHIVCGLLLFGIVRRTLMSAPSLRGSPLRTTSIDGTALAAALLWMLHPLASEPVDYATQRTESLMGLFMLLTLFCTVRSGGSARRGRWEAAACLSCACGMASKETMVVAPLVVLLYDRSFQFDSIKKALQSHARLYVGLSLTSLILVALVWQGSRSTAGFSTGVSSGTYLLTQMSVIPRYLRLTVWPDALVLDYGLPAAVSLRNVAAETALILGLLLMTLVALVRWPMMGCLGAIFFLTLAPTSSIVPIATEVGAERRMYVPLMALSVLAVVVGRAILNWIVVRAPQSSRRVAVVGVTVTALVLLALGARTVSRNREFADPVVLWRTVVDRYPHGRARLGLGMALIAAGNRTEGVAQLQAAAADYDEARSVFGLELFVDGRTDEAIDELQQFVQIRSLHPSRIPARVVLGEALASKGRLDEAVIEFEHVLQQAPHHAEAQANLALAHRRLAETHWRAGNFGDAATHAEDAVGLNPRDAETHNLFGVVLASQGRVAEAIEQFRQAVSLNPGDSKARANLQQALTLGGREK